MVKVMEGHGKAEMGKRKEICQKGSSQSSVEVQKLIFSCEKQLYKRLCPSVRDAFFFSKRQIKLNLKFNKIQVNLSKF